MLNSNACTFSLDWILLTNSFSKTYEIPAAMRLLCSMLISIAYFARSIDQYFIVIFIHFFIGIYVILYFFHLLRYLPLLSEQGNLLARQQITSPIPNNLPTLSIFLSIIWQFMLCSVWPMAGETERFLWQPHRIKTVNFRLRERERIPFDIDVMMMMMCADRKSNTHFGLKGKHSRSTWSVFTIYSGAFLLPLSFSIKSLSAHS